MAKRIIIYGAGYPDVVKLIKAINLFEESWKIIGFVDDTVDKIGTVFMQEPIIGDGRRLADLRTDGTWFFNNVYSTMARRRLVTGRLIDAGCRRATLIHPSVDRGFTKVGDGTIISQGVALGSNVSIGSHCAIRLNSVINHDNLIEDHVFIGPGVTLCGRVTIRSGAYIGAGSTIIEDVEVGTDTLVGAGAVVLADVPAGQTVVGVPARELRKEVGPKPSPRDDAIW